MQETKSKSHFVYEKAAKKPTYKVYLLFLDFFCLWLTKLKGEISMVQAKKNLLILISTKKKWLFQVVVMQMSM